MAGLMQFDYFGDAKRAGDHAAEQKRVGGLRSLMGDYYGAQDPKLGEIARLDPSMAANVQKDQQGQEDRKRERVGQMATTLLSLPKHMRPAAYRQMSPEFPTLGIQGAPPDYSDELEPLLQSVSTQFGGAKQAGAGWQNLGNGYVMNAAGEVKQAYQNSEQDKASYGYIPDPTNPENEVYARRVGDQFFDLNGSPLYGGGQQAPQAPQRGSGDVMATLQGMGAQFPGVQMTSGTRSPADNARVGGVPNSQHLRGTAADFVVPPAIRPQFMQAAQGQGFQVIDEGDHLHTQLPNRGGSRGPGPMPRNIPASRPRYKEGGAAGQYVTMNPAEVQALGLPVGTVAQRGPTGQVQIVNKPRDIPGGQSQVIDNPDGTQTIIPAGKTTEDQNKSAGYAVRMEKALADIERYSAAEPGADRPGLGTAAVEFLLPESLEAYGKSEGRQNVEAAQLDALDAALTLNTGAAYTKEQLRSLAKSYFPQPGNPPAVIAEKKARLANLVQTAKIRARGALPQNGKPGAAPSGQNPPAAGGQFAGFKVLD